MPYIKDVKIPQGLDKGTLDAGRRACAQLVRAVSAETSAPLRRAAAGSALARLHELLIKNGRVMIAALQPIDDVRATVSALVKVYLVSLREVATLTATPGPSAAGEDEAHHSKRKGIPGAETPEPHAAEYGQQRPGSGSTTRDAESRCGSAGGGTAAGHGAGPFPEDWVPLLVDSSALVANCLSRGVFTITSTAAASGTIADLQHTEVYASGSPTLASALLLSDALPALSCLLSAEAQRGPARALLTPRQLATCLKPLSELIAATYKFHDELLPISPQRLRQPHPSAPNSPTTATTVTTTRAPSPPTPAPTSSTSIPTAAGPSAAAPAAAKLSQGTESCSKAPAAANGDPEGSASAPVPQGHELTTRSTSPAPLIPQTLGPAVLRAAAKSGVVEAACRAAVGALEQGGSKQQQQQRQEGTACVAGGDREQLVAQLLELPRQLLTLLWCGEAGSLPEETLQAILAGPCVQVRVARQYAGNRSCTETQVCPCISHRCSLSFFRACLLCSRRRHAVLQLPQTRNKYSVSFRCCCSLTCPKNKRPAAGTRPPPQYALAAHSVSQLHAVDGGTTYGLPYDSLIPPVREKAKDTLACYGAINAVSWWMRTCACGGYELPPRGLTPRSLFELCLRKAEVAADSWRRRNGLPAAAAAAAAGGVGGVSGSSGQGTRSSSGKAASSGRQPRQDKVALSADEMEMGRQAGLCRTGCAADLPRATLYPSQCPKLAVRAMSCSLALMESSCGAGAGAGTGEAEARVLNGTGSGAGGSGGTDRMASSSGNAGVGEGDRGAGGGSLDGARGGGNGDGMQGSSSPGEEAGGSASVGAGSGGQGVSADMGISSGGCGDAAKEACGGRSGSGSGSDSGSKDSGTWVRDGGPLARRWWRAAVAAVHCGMDELEAVGLRGDASCVGQVLDLSLAMPETDPGGTQRTVQPIPIVFHDPSATLRTCTRSRSCGDAPARAARVAHSVRFRAVPRVSSGRSRSTRQ